MSIRSVSRNKRTSRSFLNQPIEYREVMRKRNSHEMVGALEYAPITPNSRFAQTPQAQSRLQNLLRKPPLCQTPLEKGKHVVAMSQKKQRRMLSKNEKIHLSTIKRTLTSSIKSFKEPQTSPLQRINTVNTDQGLERQQQKLQLKNIKLQQRNSQALLEQEANYSLDEINERLQNLVTRKLKLVIKETHKNNDISASVINIMRQNINQELMGLVEIIKYAKNNTRGTELEMLNQKIYFIQTLLAEQTTQGELMKKYYYKVTSNKKKGKIGDFNHFKLTLSDVYKDFTLMQKQKRRQNVQKKIQKHKPLFQSTRNQQVYKKPNLADYESYRFKHKNFAPNLQPIPRSSYNREYFYMKSSPDPKIISKDHSPYSPNHKTPFTSIYDKDYKSIKTQIINHKELDAYKNKFKVLKINYMPKNKLQSVSIDRTSYIKDAQSSSRVYSPQVFNHRKSENQLNYNKHMFNSEAHRSFKAEELFERSRIKHQQLKEFQYRMKSLFKA